MRNELALRFIVKNSSILYESFQEQNCCT